MDIFKNKYYKVFPLSIFITKCAEKKVTFKNPRCVNIFKSIVKVENNGNLKDDDTELFHNGAKYTIKQRFNENNIRQGHLLDKDGNKCSTDVISKALENYVYATHVVNNNEGERINNYNLVENGFNKENIYYLYFYKIINNKVSLYNLKGGKIDSSKSDEKKNLGTIEYNENFKSKKTYKEKISFILKQLFPDINFDEYRFILIDGEQLKEKEKDNYNLGIYKSFIEKLQDDNVKEIKIVLDKYYHPKINNILLSEDLGKIYKITDDKKDEIKNLLDNDYGSYKYSALQEKLNVKSITIQNGDIDKDIENLNNVTITITADPDKNIIVPKQCTIKFEAGNNLFIKNSEKYPTSKIIDFSDSKGGITIETDITDYINENYKEIKDKCLIASTNDESGKFKDGTVVTVTINKEIPGITSAKDPNKVYVNVKFKVSDTNKFKLNGKLATSNNFDLELEKDKKITDLLTEIIKKLDNTDLKDGYKIEKDNTVVDNKETELVDGATYIITLDNNDTNFVVEIKKEDPKGKGKDNNNNNDNNDNNTKTDNKYCGGKGNGKKNKKSGKCC